MATYSSFLVWEIPRTEEPGGLQSMGLQTVVPDLVTKQQREFVSLYCVCVSHSVISSSLQPHGL